VRPRPLDLAELLNSLAPLMQRLVGEQVRLLLDVHEPCPIVADPGQRERLTLNLVANARDSMPHAAPSTCAAGGTRRW
jgi:signal transduction histidine kinase